MLLLTPHCSKLLLFFIIFLLSFSLSLSCDSSPLSFTFSPPLHFPFSLHLEFVGLGCDWDAMLGVVGLQWFFVDRASQRWFVVGLSVVRWVSFAIWHRWVLIQWFWLILVGFLFRWLGSWVNRGSFGCWVWVDRGGWEMGVGWLIGVVERWGGFGCGLISVDVIWFVILGLWFLLWFCDSLICDFGSLLC